MVDGLLHFEFVHPADHLVDRAEAQLGHDLPQFFGNEEEEVDDVLRLTVELFAQLRSEGSLPGILRNVPKEQQAESITTALNRLVKNFRENAPPVSSLEGERKLTLQIIDEIEKLYDDRFPKMLDQSVDLGQGRSQWTIRRWMDETRQSVKTMK